jgi:hypothetical protein
MLLPSRFGRSLEPLVGPVAAAPVDAVAVAGGVAGGVVVGVAGRERRPQLWYSS